MFSISIRPAKAALSEQFAQGKENTITDSSGLLFNSNTSIQF